MMRKHGIRALAGRRFKPCTTDSRHHLPVAPNRIWLADITYIATGQGWLYLAAVLDLATRKKLPLGRLRRAMRDHMRAELPLAALMMAGQRQRPKPGLVRHSDRSQPTCCRDLRQATRRNERHAVDEPYGLLLRQRPDGKLLPHV